MSIILPPQFEVYSLFSPTQQEGELPYVGYQPVNQFSKFDILSSSFISPPHDDNKNETSKYGETVNNNKLVLDQPSHNKELTDEKVIDQKIFTPFNNELYDAPQEVILASSLTRVRRDSECSDPSINPDLDPDRPLIIDESFDEDGITIEARKGFFNSLFGKKLRHTSLDNSQEKIILDQTRFFIDDDEELAIARKKSVMATFQSQAHV
ncbi:8457_t:CDS:2 [Ambispora leptoticha]|uniref:8457_t:CDS:1 n=1 Tax=Ambispora leptoticha TaxID=144679 RepID=A0A9N9ABC9_9GLOM|nr:8457_t:CDS:2 [Ambispora leptoticha]